MTTPAAAGYRDMAYRADIEDLRDFVVPIVVFIPRISVAAAIRVYRRRHVLRDLGPPDCRIIASVTLEHVEVLYATRALCRSDTHLACIRGRLMYTYRDYPTLTGRHVFAQRILPRILAASGCGADGDCAAVAA